MASRSSMAYAVVLSFLVASPVLARHTNTARRPARSSAPSAFRRPAAPRPSPCSTAPSRCSTPSSSRPRSRASTRRSRPIRRARWRTGASRSAGGATRSSPASARPRRCSRARRGDSRRRRSAPKTRARAGVHRRRGAAVRRLRDRRPAHARRSRTETRWPRLAAANPDDIEATIFYALAIAAAAPPTDKTYANQLKAGANPRDGSSPASPDHPGLSHYIIHSYDVPPLADRALEAARRYAKIAPSAPHALHMPSHTFTRVGSWQESIDTNIASGEAARRDGATAEELHAMDYRIYAYLQTAQDAAARATARRAARGGGRFDPEALGVGRARLRRCLRAGGDPRALRARARRLGRGRRRWCPSRADS